MDPMRMIDTPIEILRQWVSTLESEMRYDAQAIVCLEQEIQMKRINAKHTEQVIAMVKIAIDLKELPPPVS